MQAYAVVGLQDKMDVVWGFVKAHLKAKTIVFLSTCKQVQCIVHIFMCIYCFCSSFRIRLLHVPTPQRSVLSMRLSAACVPESPFEPCTEA